MASRLSRLGAAVVNLLLFVFTLVIGWLIWWFIVAPRGQNPGKAVVGLRVIRTDGRAADTGLMLVRGLVSAVVGSLGGLWLIAAADSAWLLWDEDAQTLHDKIFGTIVVKAAGSEHTVGAGFVPAELRTPPVQLNTPAVPVAGSATIASLYDPGVPAEVKARFDKGIAACDAGDWRAAYGHFLAGCRMAEGAQFRELVFFRNFAAMASDETSSWVEVLRLAEEMFQVSKASLHQLAILYPLLTEGGSELGSQIAQQKDALFELTAPKNQWSPEWSGLIWLAGSLSRHKDEGFRASFEGLAARVFLQILEILRQVDSPHGYALASPGELCQVEALADTLVGTPQRRVHAGQLYAALATVPESTWLIEGGTAFDGKPYQDHREHIDLEIEVARAVH